MFGRAVVPVSARGRIVQMAMDAPVEFAGVTVHPGDVVLADQNGVVFVPAADRRVVALAERIVGRESAMAEAVSAGQPVTEVMHDSKFPTIAEGHREQRTHWPDSQRRPCPTRSTAWAGRERCMASRRCRRRAAVRAGLHRPLRAGGHAARDRR